MTGTRSECGQFPEDEEDTPLEPDGEDMQPPRPLSLLVDVNDIVGFPFSPRLQLDGKYVQELANSISRFGLRESPVVRPHPSLPEKYEGITGEYTVKALLGLNRTQVPVTVMALDDTQARILALQSNLEGKDRKSLKSIEIAFAIKGLHDLGLSMAEIGEALGKSKQWVSSMHKLHQVHPDVHAEMSRRMDSPYMWTELVKLNPDEQIALLKKIRETVDRVPVRLVKRLVRAALEATAEERVKLVAIPLDELDEYLKLLEDAKLRGSLHAEREFDCPYQKCKLRFKVDYGAELISWKVKLES
jgi:ParB/RepB/Spo0J family partition protein